MLKHRHLATIYINCKQKNIDHQFFNAKILGFSSRLLLRRLGLFGFRPFLFSNRMCFHVSTETKLTYKPFFTYWTLTGFILITGVRFLWLDFSFDLFWRGRDIFWGWWRRSCSSFFCQDFTQGWGFTVRIDSSSLKK